MRRDGERDLEREGEEGGTDPCAVGHPSQASHAPTRGSPTSHQASVDSRDVRVKACPPACSHGLLCEPAGVCVHAPWCAVTTGAQPVGERGPGAGQLA